MPQPTPYTRGFNFTDYQSSHPDDPVPGYRLDTELDGVSTTLQGVLGNLALIQRDDGRLIDGAVTIDSIDHDLFLAIAAAAPQGPQGIQGIQGVPGTTAPNPAFTMQAHAVAPGGAATVSVTGAYPNLTIDFGVPKGDPAAPGAATLEDADYGDVTVSASGSHMNVDTVMGGQTPSVVGHVHTVANVTGLQAQLDGINAAINAKLSAGGGVIAGNLTVTGAATVNGNLTVGHLNNASDYLAAAAHGYFWTDQSGTFPNLVCQADNNLVLSASDVGGSARAIWSVFMRSSTATFNIAVVARGIAPAGGDNSDKIPTTAWVNSLVGGYQPAGSYASTAALATKADAITPVAGVNIDLAVTDGQNGAYIMMTGGTPRTVTFGTPTQGLAMILVNRGTVNMTIACAGGYYKNGSAVATANLTLAPNGKLTAFHEGGGVWTFDGTGF